MRTHSIIAALAAAFALGACTYVERPAPAPTVVQTPPTVVAPMAAVPPTVTVRPAY
jgi:multidrug efflux pump subunit AcrA (membrane-fusion protein)